MSLNTADIQQILPHPLSTTSFTSDRLCSLWSNYGQIRRITFPPPATPSTIILKFIDPPLRTRASESDSRKTLSYRAERYFYTHLSQLLPEDVKAPHNYAVTHPNWAHRTLLLEDLGPGYPRNPARRTALSMKEVETTLHWLAGFHATFWESRNLAVKATPTIPPPSRSSQDAEGVWEMGSYWYLDTRREEFAEISDEDSFIIPWAEKLQSKLCDPSQPGRTLLHGDLKGANIAFTEDGSSCAVYDFQYIGKGLGVVDLVYFLGTSVGERVMADEGERERLLGVYYEELRRRLGREEEGYTRKVFRRQLEWAMADWYRFMAGWGFWGNSWVQEVVPGIVKRWEEEGME